MIRLAIGMFVSVGLIAANFQGELPPEFRVEVSGNGEAQNRPEIITFASGRQVIDAAIPDLAGVSNNEFKYFGSHFQPPILQVDADTRKLIISVTGDAPSAFFHTWDMGVLGPGAGQNLILEIENPNGIVFKNSTNVGQELSLKSAFGVSLEENFRSTHNVSISAPDVTMEFGTNSAPSMRVAADTFENLGDLSIQWDLSLDLQESFRNGGWIRAEQILMDVPKLINPAGKDVGIMARGSGHAHLKISTDNFENEGRLLSEGTLLLESTGELRNSGTIASGSAMEISGLTLENKREILSGSELAIGGANGGMAQLIDNESGNIRSANDMTLRAKKIYNRPASKNGQKKIDEVPGLDMIQVTTKSPVEFSDYSCEKSAVEERTSQIPMMKEPAQLSVGGDLKIEGVQFDNIMSSIQVGGDFILDPLTNPSFNQQSLFYWEKRDLVASDTFDDSIAANMGQNVGTVLFCAVNPLCWIGATASAISGPDWKSATYNYMIGDGREVLAYVAGGRGKLCRGRGYDNGENKLFRCDDTFEAKAASLLAGGSVKGSPENWHQSNYKRGGGAVWISEEKPLTADDFHVTVADQIILPDLSEIVANRHLYQELLWSEPVAEDFPLAPQYLWQDILRGRDSHRDGGIAQLLSYYSPDPNARSLVAMAPTMETRVVEALLFKAIGPNKLNIQDLINESQARIRDWRLPLGTLPSDENIDQLKAPIILPVYSDLEMDGKKEQVLMPAIILDKKTIQKSRQQKANVVSAKIIELNVIGDMVVQGLLESTSGHLRAYARNLSIEGALESAEDIDLVADGKLLIHTIALEISGSMSPKPTSIFSKGKIKMHAREKFEAQGIEVRGDNIHVSSEGDLIVIPKKIVEEYREEIISSFNEQRRSEFCESFISNAWDSLSGLKLEAVGELKVSGGKFKAVDVIDIKSHEGSVSTEKLAKVCEKEISKADKGLWAYFFGEDASSTSTSKTHEGTIFESEYGGVNMDGKYDVNLQDMSLLAEEEINILAGRHLNISNSVNRMTEEECLSQNHFFDRAEDGRFYIWGTSNRCELVSRDALLGGSFLADRINMRAGGEAHTYGGRFFGRESMGLNGTQGVYDHSIGLHEGSKLKITETGWSIGGTFTEAEQSVETGIGFKYGTEKNSTDSSTGSHAVAPDIDISSTSGEVELEATQLLGNTFLGGKKVTVKAAVADLCFENTSLEAFIGLKAGLKTHILAAMAHAIQRTPDDVEVWEDGVNLGFSLLQSGMEIAMGLLIPVEGGLWLSASAEYQVATQCLQLAIQPRIVGEDIQVDGEEAVIFVGAQLKGKTGHINTRDLRVESQELKGKSSKTDIKGKADVMLQGAGITTIQAEVSQKGTGSTTHQHSTLEFEEELKFDVSCHAIFKGATVTAGKILGNFGYLLVESVKSELAVSGGGAKLTLSPEALEQIGTLLTGGGISIESRKKTWVEEVTQLVGTDAAKLIVHNTLELTGAIIAHADRDEKGVLTEKGGLELEAARLVLEDIETADDGLLLGVEASVSRVKGMMGTVQGDFGYVDKDGKVKATLGEGRIKIDDVLVEDDLEGLNRDLAAVSEEDGVDIKPIHFYIPVPDFEHPEKIMEFFEDAYDGLRHPAMRVENSFHRILNRMDWVFDDAERRFPEMEPRNLKMQRFYRKRGAEIEAEVDAEYVEEEAEYAIRRAAAKEAGDEDGVKRAERAQELLQRSKEDKELNSLTKKMASELLQETAMQIGTLENGGAPFRVYDNFLLRMPQLIDRYWKLGGGFHAPESTIWFTIPVGGKG